MSGLIGWLSSLPLSVLYLLIALVSLIEGIVPPVPGDVAAAMLAFIAARAGGAWIPTTIAVVAGSVGGSCVVWWLGRRYGTSWLAHQMARFKLTKSEAAAEATEHRIEDAYARYGWIALFVSRFIPGVRAMAPAAAGALRVPLWETILVLTASSTIWYGAVTWIAFKVGSDWQSVRSAIERFARDAGIAGTLLGVAVAIGLFGWWRWRRRKPAP